jgi:hypothetical protein
MSRNRRLSGLVTCLAALLFLGVSACSSPVGLGERKTDPPATQRPAPFRDDDSVAGSPSALPAVTAEKGLPFHDNQSLPPGILLTVQLVHSVSDQDPGVNGAFVALVDAPVAVDGNILIPRGAEVAGRVESTQASSVKGIRGYVRLTLDSVRISGLDVPIQTSSLFAKADNGTSARNVSSTNIVRLEKGRRLTFRLTEPFYLASQSAQAGH